MPPQTARDYQSTSTHYDPGEIQVCEEEETQADQENASINSRGLPPQFESIAACWILKIRECCKLTQSTTEEIIERVTDLNRYILSEVFLAVKSALTEARLDMGKVPKLKEILSKWKIW